MTQWRSLIGQSFVQSPQSCMQASNTTVRSCLVGNSPLDFQIHWCDHPRSTTIRHRSHGWSHYQGSTVPLCKLNNC
jgi:hypothetical protein